MPTRSKLAGQFSNSNLKKIVSNVSQWTKEVHFNQQIFLSLKHPMLLHFVLLKQKKPHTIAETLVKPCLLDCAKIALDDKAYNKLKQVSLSNDTIKNRIVEMSSDIKIQLISTVSSSALPFAIQLDESTDVTNLSQLLVYICHVSGASMKEDFFILSPFENYQAVDVLQVVSDFFEESNLSWNNLVAVCTDGAPAMIGGRSGFTALVKQKNPRIRGTHCLPYRQAFAAKTLPKTLNTVLEIIISIVNYAKASAVNSRLFRQLFKEIDSQHETQLFHTNVSPCIIPFQNHYTNT